MIKLIGTLTSSTSKEYATPIEIVIKINKWLSLKASLGHQKSMDKLINLGMMEYRGWSNEFTLRTIIQNYL